MATHSFCHELGFHHAFCITVESHTSPSPNYEPKESFPSLSLSDIVVTVKTKSKEQSPLSKDICCCWKCRSVRGVQVKHARGTGFHPRHYLDREHWSGRGTQACIRSSAQPQPQAPPGPPVLHCILPQSNVRKVEADETAHWVKVLSAKTDNLSLILRNPRGKKN